LGAVAAVLELGQPQRIELPEHVRLSCEPP
jgi:hypothetical protein